MNIAIWIAAFIFIFSILWHFIDLQNALYDRRPNIILTENPIVITNQTLEIESKTYTKKPIIRATSHMTRIRFSNRPKNRTEKNNSEEVRAEISFYSKSNKRLLGPLQGRWHETDEPPQMQRGDIKKLESIDFPNNGAVRTLNLLFKYPEDECCYAYNNASFSYMHQNVGRNPYLIIKAKHFYINIELMGNYIHNKKFRFEVTTKGKGDTFKIRKEGGKWEKIEKNQTGIKLIEKKKNPSHKT